METRTDCCNHCAFYCESNPGTGECRRHAPQPNSSFFVSRSEATGTIKTDVHWPKVYESNWCGDFKIKQHNEPHEAHSQIHGYTS